MRQVHAVVLMAGLGALSSCTYGQSFTLLDSATTVDSNAAVALGVSGNGRVIVGSNLASVRERAMVWKLEGTGWTRSELPSQSPTSPLGRAVTASYDGDVVVGMDGDVDLDNTWVFGSPAIWRGVVSGPVVRTAPFGPPEHPVQRGCLSGVQMNGSVGLGWIQSSSGARELWSVAGTSTRLSPSSPNSYYSSFLSGNTMSGDGSIYVGSLRDESLNRTQAFRYTADGGFELLPTAAGLHSRAEVISANGLVIGGHQVIYDGFYGHSGTTAAIWRGGVRIDVPVPAPYTDSQLVALSGNGNIAGGNARTNQLDPLLADGRAVLWINDQAIFFTDYLAQFGITMQGFVPTWVTGISDDGLTFVGFGTGAGGGASFVATVPRSCGDADFDNDGDVGTDGDIEAFFAALAGNACAACDSIDFDHDGSPGTDADIEAFFRVLAGGHC